MPTTAAMPLLERAEELRRIEDALAAARAGTGSTLVIEGPAGIGKTVLLATARSGAGMTVATARGAELEREFAYGVVRQLLEPPLAAASAEERADLLGGAAALAAPLLAPIAEPDPGAGPPAADPSFAVLHGLYWLCANLAQRGPLLVAVDDVHWADIASLRFLAYLARRLDELPIALLVTARGEGIDELLAEATAVVRPRPLSRAAVAHVVADVVGRMPDEAFAGACHGVTGGTPFLVRELARAVVEAGVEPDARHVEAVRALGPRTIARTIRGRLDRLGPAAVRLAHALAVLGPDADLRQAAAVVELDRADAAVAADALATAGIVADDRPLRFVHPIVGTAIDAALPAGERARLHAVAARRFAAQPERAAAHLLAAEPDGDQWAVRTLREAAREAVAQGAPHSAVALLRRALAEPPDAASRGPVLLELGFAESYARDPAAAEHLEAALDSAQERVALVSTTMALGRMLQLAGRHDRAVEVYDRTLGRVVGRDLAAELSLEGALVSAAQLLPETVDVAAARIPGLRRRCEAAPDAAPTAFAPLAFAAAGAGEPAQTVARMARHAFSAHPRLLPEAADRPPFFYHACSALIWCDEYDDVRSRLDVEVAAAQRLGSLPNFVALLATRAWVHLRAGEPREAEADAQLSIASPGAPRFFRVEALAFLVEALVERGELAEAERVLAGCDIADTIVDGLLLVARGRWHVAAGRPEAGLADLLAAGAVLARVGATGPGLTAWRSEAALAQLALGQSAEAGALVDEELALARAFGTARAIGVAQRAAGLVRGDTDLLRSAVATLAESPARLEHGRAQVELGAALRRTGHRREAREPLAAALDLAHRRGARALAERARTELLAAGARPRRALLTGVEALTPSERRVALMAARGLTNREIAQALFVTARTVEGHLTHVFQKLALDSRADLPAALRDQ